MTDVAQAPASKATRYSGCTSYGYLDPGADFRVFTLASEIDRVPSTTVPVAAPDAVARPKAACF